MTKGIWTSILSHTTDSEVGSSDSRFSPHRCKTRTMARLLPAAVTAHVALGLLTGSSLDEWNHSNRATSDTAASLPATFITRISLAHAATQVQREISQSRAQEGEKSFDFAGPLRRELMRQHAAPQREEADRIRQEDLKRIRHESTAETISVLLSCPITDLELGTTAVSVSPPGSSIPLVNKVKALPRVDKLINAAKVNDTAREDVVRQVRDAFNESLRTLPSFIPRGEPALQCIRTSVGLEAFTVVLAEVDRDATSLPELLAYYRAQQQALHDECSASRVPQAAATQTILSPDVTITVYACEVLLNRYLDNSKLRFTLAPSGLQALEHYRLYESSRSQDRTVGSDDCSAIMEVATTIAERRS